MVSVFEIYFFSHILMFKKLSQINKYALVSKIQQSVAAQNTCTV